MDCTKHEAVEARMKVIEDDIKDIFIRLRNQETSTVKTEEMAKSLKEQMEKLSVSIDIRFKDLGDKIDKLKDLPGKRWNSVVNAIIAAVIALTISYLKIGGE